jgi:hypothetical protein
MTSTTPLLRGKPKLSLQKKAIEDHTFFVFVYQGEFLGDMLTQASLSMHKVYYDLVL